MAIDDELLGGTSTKASGELVNGGSVMIDHNHPLYLSSTNVPGALLLRFN